MQTEKITIWGIVQGVGFRPFIAKLGDEMAMAGVVRNNGGLVEITVTDTKERIDAFVTAIEAGKPLPAEIVHLRREIKPQREFQGFSIAASGQIDDEAPMIPADLALCPACFNDLNDKANPRYRHPFISCMACGPRYTIIDKIPYDREHTAMADFPMCSFCEKEYTDRKDRRYHAQTISCHDCGPQLKQYQSGLEKEDAVKEAISLLIKGEIIAVKGVGGYNFIASPFCHEAVTRLRELKGREEKPFAVMFYDENQVREYCCLTEAESALLNSAARPIVLLETKKAAFSPEVNKTSRYTGSFLPSMGLQYLLIEACGPLIVTSGNLSDMPMIREDEKMFRLYEEKKELLAAVFYHDRGIRMTVDDSVVRVIDHQPQMIRRAKGYAPVPLFIAADVPLKKEDQILALGGQLKAAFTLSKSHFAYVSQFFGDLDAEEIRENYVETIESLKALFHITPQLLVTDMHPLYFTYDFAKEYGEKHQIPILRVQHHHAHVASVMAEHGLDGDVIGVSFDGTGYGADGTIWGGEFLVCNGAKYLRAAHLQTMPMIGGDNSMKEAWKTAMCYMASVGGAAEKSPLSTDNRYAVVKAGLYHGINGIGSSSMGRLFDAVAALLGIAMENRYEGECAIMLENAAARAETLGLSPHKMVFMYWNDGGVWQISAAPILQAIARGLDQGVAIDCMALGFHQAVGDMVAALAEKIREEVPTNQVALTGGVFQNKILMEYTLSLLRTKGFDVYYNISVGPNDGGVSLGQTYIAMEYLKEDQHVHCDSGQTHGHRRQ
ncbi:MAG TPA: carbamoyltransferase HypF [Clostridiales bacterium]|nr:carbamoyltransferase HypF [Clostridiales bacterium]